MAAVQGSKLMAKYGAKLDQAAKQHAMDEPDYGFQRIPAGITNGVAKLIACKLGEYKTGTTKGELYFRFAGVVVEPAEVVVNGQVIDPRGMQTSQMMQLCDRKDAQGKITKSQADFVADCQNMMKIMFSEQDQPGIMQLLSTGGAALEQVADLLDKSNVPPNQPIYFKFSTSVRKGRESFNKATQKMEMGEDGVWENWYGVKGLENYQPPEPGGVVDNSGAGGEEVIPDANQQAQQQAEGGGDQAPDDPNVATDGNPMDADGALTELATQAGAQVDDNDADAVDARDSAIQQLVEIAAQHGITEEQINLPPDQGGPNDWNDVVAMIGQASQQVVETPPEPKPAPPPPPVGKPPMIKPSTKPVAAPAKPAVAAAVQPLGSVKGKVCKWAVMLGKLPVTDPKTKRPKVSQCEIVATYAKTQTCDLKDLTDNKVYKSVKWSELKPS